MTFSLSAHNGGISETHSVLFFPPSQVTDSIKFVHTPLYKNASFLHQKYVIEKRSIAQIAEEIFSSKDAVRGGLRRAGIPIREPRNHHGNPSQPRFGQKVRKGQAVPFQVEQKVIRTVRQLRDQGLTLRAIAKILDEMKVPTKCQGRSWHPEMVSRVLFSPISEP